MIIVDMWGGKLSQEHVARYMLPLNEALQLAAHELEDGFLVNLRREVAWGPVQNFDTRLEE